MRRRTFLGVAVAALGPLRGAPVPLGTIAFTQRDGLRLRDLPDGPPRKLINATRIEEPRFSASGQWLSYYQEDALHVVSIDGRLNRDFGHQDRGSLNPGCQWWPGRDALLVRGETGVNVFTAADGWTRAAREIHGADLPVLFSPDGKDLVYVDELAVGIGPGGEDMRTGRLRRLSLETPDGKPEVIFSNYLSGQILCTWSRHAGSILFWEDPDFSASAVADGLELFRVSPAGGSSQSMGVSTPVYRDMVSLSPGGDRLAAVTGGGRNQWEEKRIAILDPGTGAVSYLTDESMAVAFPAWSPGGDQIAFSAAPAPVNSKAHIGGGEPARRLLAKRRIWIADVSGMSLPKPLTSDPAYRDEEPMWSSDGKRILFCRIDHRNNKTLWLMGADGGSLVQVAELDTDPGLLGVDGTWFGYYGYIDWHNMVDWFRGALFHRGDEDQSRGGGRGIQEP
jgi:Tol biopolymer transport system component